MNAKMRCLCNEKKYKRSYLYESVSVKMRIKPPITGYFVFRQRPEIAAAEFLPLYKVTVDIFISENYISVSFASNIKVT